MSSATDVFARFVDLVAELLDDHHTRHDDVARRAHMSRFHFDRLITAASGETPAWTPPMVSTSTRRQG